MLKFCFGLMVLAIVNAGFRADAQGPVRAPASNPANRETMAETVQISLDVDADLLIENSEGQRVGLDFTSRKFVDEIPGARVVANEGSATFVLPFDKSGQPYKISVAGKSASRVDADLRMTGAGFVVGFRGVRLTAGQRQTMTMAANGLHLSFTAGQDGLTPQLFMTTQSGRDKPSYRFEVGSPELKTGKTITVDLDREKGRLYFKADDARKVSFTATMRRTNPSGTRDLFAHKDISFGKVNSYAMDFGQWDGRGELCFYEICNNCKENVCTKLRSDPSGR
ncbi:MAG: hypothetical protein QOK48_2194 [Blastocatellia bacterium]|jgi:hypothetical protein|nr:hypothetical protein [Blastocatellia bacterium]